MGMTLASLDYNYLLKSKNNLIVAFDTHQETYKSQSTHHHKGQRTSHKKVLEECKEKANFTTNGVKFGTNINQV